MKRWISLIVKLLISAGIVFWVVQKFNVSVEDLDTADFQWAWAFPVALSGVFMATFQALRWRTLYGADEVPPFREFFNFILVGYFFSILLPWSLGGDAVKAVVFGKRHDGLLHSSMAILFGRVFGITSLFILFWIAYFLYGFELDPRVTSALAAVTVAAVAGIITIFTVPGFILSKLPEKSKFRPILSSLGTVSTGRWIAGAVISVFMQLSIFLLLYSAFKLVGSGITFPHILFYAPLTTLILFLPFSFAGIGLREGSLSFFLTPFEGITPAHVVQASLVNYVVLLVLALFGGIIFLFHKKKTQQ